MLARRLAVGLAAFLVAGFGSNQNKWTIGGAVGSMFGKGGGKVVAIGAGALIGGYVGDRIGKKMDEKNKRKAEATAKKKDRTGRTCRKFKHTVTAGGVTETTTGVACQRKDGTWETVQSGR